MPCKIFLGQGQDLERKINEWLKPNVDITHVSQSSVSAIISEKPVPLTLITVFYTERGMAPERILE
jgi:hypothetical protein